MLDVTRDAEIQQEKHSMRLREHSAVKAKGDYLWIDPRKLKVDPTYNVRDMESADTKAHVAWLKALIIANGGVHTPLEVRLEGKDIYIVAGHCRQLATIQAIQEGHEILTVPCMPEPKGTSEIDRVVNLVVSNSGKPLGPLEVAKVVKRLDGFGWPAKQIAERFGWKSVNSVKQHLEMLELSEPVKQHIRDGTVSATTARRLAKSDLTPEQQDELLRSNEQENARIKGKRTRVTPRQINAATRPKPPAAPAPAAAEPPPTPSPAPATATTGHITVPGSISSEQRDDTAAAFEADQPLVHGAIFHPAEGPLPDSTLVQASAGFIGDELHEERPTVMSGARESDRIGAGVPGALKFSDLHRAAFGDCSAFVQEIEKYGVTLPLLIAPDCPCTLIDANAKAVLVVDYDGTMENDKAVAITNWVMLAINTCGGFAARADGSSNPASEQIESVGEKAASVVAGDLAPQSSATTTAPDLQEGGS